MEMQDHIFRIIVPETTEVEIKDGVKKEKTKKMFPGYILVEMVMSDEAWYIVRNTPGVTGFIGSSGKGAKPTPLLPQEIDKVLATMGMSRLDSDSDLKVGDTVNIIDGPFKGMTGKIDTVDKDNNRLNVLIDLFGQETPVEVELFQVNKA
jgi:transcriptional antiterminator NusG